MVSLKSLLIFTTTALASTLPLSSRKFDNDLILKDLAALDDSVNTLTKTIRAYPGGALTSSPILFAITGVHLANRKCYYDSMALSPQTLSESQKIVDYVRDFIAVDIPIGVETLKSKKKLFVDAGLSGVVVGGLDLLLYDHRTFSEVLGGKADPSLKDQVDEVVKKIDDSIVSGINAFKNEPIINI